MQAWILRNRLTIGTGVALFVVLILVLSQFGGGSSQATTTQQATSSGNPWFWLAALVLLAGAGASFANRGGAPARWALGILIVILGLKFVSGVVFGEKAVEVEQNVREGMANVVLGKTPSQKDDGPIASTSLQTARNEAKWERLADGSIPVGVWSYDEEVPMGCRPLFSAGNGTDYVARYRVETQDQHAHRPGTYPQMSHFSFKLLEAGKGRDKVAFSIDCPGRK